MDIARSLICPAFPYDIWTLILDTLPITAYSIIARLSSYNKKYMYSTYKRDQVLLALYIGPFLTHENYCPLFCQVASYRRYTCPVIICVCEAYPHNHVCLLIGSVFISLYMA